MQSGLPETIRGSQFSMIRDPLRKYLADMGLVVNQNFPEVPSHLLHESRLANIFSDAWKHNQFSKQPSESKILFECVVFEFLF